MNYQIELISPKNAEELYCKITANLPEYFGLPECNELYARGVHSCINFAAKVDGTEVGLLSLDFPYPSNSSIYWMGVMAKYQGQGIGYSLILEASSYAKQHHTQTMTVETLAPSESDKSYLKIYQFYENQGFRPLFNLKPLGYEWNMVYMVKRLDNPLHELMIIEKDARKFGFDWPHQEMIIEQAISECDEIREAIANDEPKHRLQEEIGDLLHTAISLCISAGFDPDQTLEKVIEKFSARMHALKAVANEDGLKNLKGQSIEYMNELWDRVKKSY